VLLNTEADRVILQSLEIKLILVLEDEYELHTVV